MAQQQTIMVTGTAGFIGFHLAQRLLTDGWRVIGVDNFNDYYDVRLKEARHAELEKHPSYVGLRADICDCDAMTEIIRREQPEPVVHLAAQAGVRYSLDHPFAYLKSNLEGFLSILEAVRHGGVKRLVYASSSSVYGGNTKLPFSEDDRVETPVSLYAATKRADELMAHCYTHLYGIQTIGLRFFTVYGPWGRPDMAMWIFADRIRRGESIPVYNYGKMQRDFTYVDDIVAGVMGTITVPDLDDYEIFNLGNHRSEQLMDLIAEIEQALGQKAELDLQPIQPGDVPATFADVERASRKLGYKPTTPISIGVPRFIDWFKQYHS